MIDTKTAVAVTVEAIQTAQDSLSCMMGTAWKGKQARHWLEALAHLDLAMDAVVALDEGA